MDERIEERPEKKYFAASNSANGFVNYYGACFGATSCVDHLYVIKGGPGTGKSRFMRAVAKAAEKQGYDAEYYYCSSDPNSLDGVRLTRGGARPRRIGIIDGTSPHAWEPSCPGAREEIVNLGDFWNSVQLEKDSERIGQLTQMKKQCYDLAYRYLGGCGEVARVVDQQIEPCVLHNKINALAQRLLRHLPQGNTFTAEPALQNALGMTGCVHFSTFENEANTLYRMDAYYGVEYRITQALLEQSKKNRLDVRISFDPLYPWRIDGLFWKDSRLAVVIAPDSTDMPMHRRLYPAHYVDVALLGSCRSAIRHAIRCEKSLLAGAKDCLADAAKHHFELENIYMAAMDFGKKEAFTAQFCKTILR